MELIELIEKMELMETMENLGLMEGVSPVKAGKKERNDAVVRYFREWEGKVGRTAAYYKVCELCALSYATVVKIVKTAENGG